MKFSLAAKLALAAALALTLGGKAAFSRAAPAVDHSLFSSRATALLRAHGFATRSEQRPFGRITYAEAGACRMLVADYPPHGTMAEPLGARAKPFGPLQFVWRGEVMRKAPKLVPLTAFFVQRELRRIGLHPPRQPIVAMAASPGCGGRTIDWRPLATLPA